MHGTMEPGESKEIVISFSPDHLSQLFRDELIFDVNGVVSDLFDTMVMDKEDIQNFMTTNAVYANVP